MATPLTPVPTPFCTGTVQFHSKDIPPFFKSLGGQFSTLPEIADNSSITVSFQFFFGLPPDSKASPAKDSINDLKNSNKPLPDHLKNLLDMADKVKDGALKTIGTILDFLGASIMLYGSAQFFYIFGKTQSLDDIIGSRALVYLIFGSVLKALGESLRTGKDFNTVLGNILYLP